MYTPCKQKSDTGADEKHLPGKILKKQRKWKILVPTTMQVQFCIVIGEELEKIVNPDTIMHKDPKAQITNYYY